jgi:hypothetical protein
MAHQAVHIAKKSKKKAKKYRSLIFLTAFGFLAVISTKYVVTAALMVSVFLLAYTVNYLELWVLGIELATLTAVLIGAAFGPVIGALAGIIAVLGHLFGGQYMSIYVFWLVPSYAAAGYLAGTLNMPITQLGIAILFGLHAVFFAFMAVFDSEEIPVYIVYGALNIGFNIFLFQAVAPVLFGLMG